MKKNIFLNHKFLLVFTFIICYLLVFCFNCVNASIIVDSDTSYPDLPSQYIDCNFTILSDRF